MTTDDELVPPEGEAGHELADVTEGCCKYPGVRVAGSRQVGCGPVSSLKEDAWK